MSVSSLPPVDATPFKAFPLCASSEGPLSLIGLPYGVIRAPVSRVFLSFGGIIYSIMITSIYIAIMLLSYGQGSNSVMQSDWLKVFECDVISGQYETVMPAY